LNVRLERLKIWLGWRCKTINVSGLHFRVRRLAADEHFVRDVVSIEEYSPAGYEIEKDAVVIDIGGNVGAFAVYAASKARGGRVVVLEPVRESLQLLTDNVALNGLDNVAIRQAAVVAERKPVQIFLSDYGSGGHSVVDALVQPHARSEEIEGLTLSDVFQEFGLTQCDLLKMDCEGAEFQILQGLQAETARQVRRIVMEYHTFPGRDKHEQACELIDQLIKLGFTIDHYTDVVGTYWGMIYARRTQSNRV
jgi:FkbM family methyltransferase